MFVFTWRFLFFSLLTLITSIFLSFFFYLYNNKGDYWPVLRDPWCSCNRLLFECEQRTCSVGCVENRKGRWPGWKWAGRTDVVGRRSDRRRWSCCNTEASHRWLFLIGIYIQIYNFKFRTSSLLLKWFYTWGKCWCSCNIVSDKLSPRHEHQCITGDGTRRFRESCTYQTGATESSTAGAAQLGFVSR